MKKIKKIFLTFLILLFSLSAYGGITCFAKKSFNLILPDNNENYMDFTSPVDLAVNDSYYIIAESNRLHIYDKINEYYYTTNFSVTIKKIFINSRGMFILSGTDIYFCDYNSDSLQLLFSGYSSFVVSENYLLTASTDNINLYEYITDAFTLSNTFSLPIGNMTVPFLAFKNGSEYEYKIGSFSDTNTTYNTSAITCDENDIYFIGSNGFFKKNGNSYTKLSDKSDYTALKYFNGKIFLTEKTLSEAKMTVFDIATQTFNNFEISSNSSSDGRLNNAEDIFGINDKFYIADTLNKRISINNKDGSFLNKISLNNYPYLVGANSDNALTVTSSTAELNGENTVYLINLKNLTNETQAVKINSVLLNEKIFTSLAASDDYFYLLTENNGENAELAIIDNSGTVQNVKFNNTLYPIKLSCDINGILFIMFKNGIISKYSDNLIQTELLNEGEKIAEFNIEEETVLKFILDIKQLPYVLTNEYLIYYFNESVQQDIYVDFYNEKIKSFTSFYDDSNVYCLFSNVIIQDFSIQLQTLTSIIVPDNYQLLDNLEVLTIKAGMPLLLFDYSELTGSEFFPVSGYIELDNDLNVIKLFETDEHIIFTGKYTGLVTKDLINVISCIDSISQETIFQGYVSVKTTVYKYPVLDSDFNMATIDKYSQTNINELISFKDISTDFYKIKYDDNKTGYIPANFVITNIIENPVNENFYIKKIIDNNITLYEDSKLSVSLTEIAGGSNIKIYSVENGIAYIRYENNGNIYTGYINNEYIVQNGKNTLKNVIIILIVILSFTITSLYLLKLKKSKSKF
jgi:hypothetical protein